MTDCHQTTSPLINEPYSYEAVERLIKRRLMDDNQKRDIHEERLGAASVSYGWAGDDSEWSLENDPDYYHPFYLKLNLLSKSHNQLVYSTLSRGKRAQLFLCLMPSAYEYLGLSLEDLMWSHWCLWMHDFVAIDQDTTREMKVELGLQGHSGFYDRAQSLYFDLPGIRSLWDNILFKTDMRSVLMT